MKIATKTEQKLVEKSEYRTKLRKVVDAQIHKFHEEFTSSSEAIFKAVERLYSGTFSLVDFSATEVILRKADLLDQLYKVGYTIDPLTGGIRFEPIMIAVERKTIYVPVNGSQV